MNHPWIAITDEQAVGFSDNQIPKIEYKQLLNWVNLEIYIYFFPLFIFFSLDSNLTETYV